MAIKKRPDVTIYQYVKYRLKRYRDSWYNLDQKDVDDITYYLKDLQQTLYTGKSDKKTVLNYKVKKVEPIPSDVKIEQMSIFSSVEDE